MHSLNSYQADLNYSLSLLVLFSNIKMIESSLTKRYSNIFLKDIHYSDGLLIKNLFNSSKKICFSEL